MQLTNMLLLQGGTRAGQGRAAQGRARQGRAGQGRAGQGTAGRTGQGTAGQGRAGQGTAGQDTKQHDDIAQPCKASRGPESSPTHLFNAVRRFVYPFFFQGSAEIAECEDGGRADVVLQVMRTEPGLKKKVGSV